MPYSNDWPTRDNDLSVADEIVNQHCEDVDHEMIGIQEITIVEEGSMQIERADWVIALEEAFEAQYGQCKGNQIAKQVMTALLIQGARIH